MTITLAIADENAKSGTASSFGNRRRALRLNAEIMQKSRTLFSVKTAQHLSEITGYSTRACESWLGGKVVLPSDALAALLHSEWGREFLATVMVNNQPRWWKQFKAWWAAIDLAVAERKLRRKRKEMLDAEFGEYASPATHAQVLQDEEFYSGQAAPNGGGYRSLDSKRGKVR